MLFILSILISLLTINYLKAPSIQHIPPARGHLPLVGHLFTLARNFHRLHDWMTEESKHQQTTWYYSVPGKLPQIVLVSPDTVKHVLKDNFDNYVKGKPVDDVLGDMMGTGIFNTDGDNWRVQRKTASQIFSQRKLKNYITHVFIKNTNAFLDNTPINTKFDIQRRFYDFTLKSFSEIAFGVHEDIQEWGDCFNEAQNIINTRFYDFTWKLKKLLKIGTEKRYAHVIHKLNNISYRIINQTKPNDDNLLSKFSQTQQFSKQQLRDIILNFLIAGRDTTAALMTWTIHELDKNPHVLRRVLREITQHVPGDIPTYENIKNLTYFHTVLLEVLRLHPSLPQDAKHSVDEDLLPDGTLVPKNTAIIFSPYVMGRMSHWENPESFDPRRWSEPHSEYKFLSFNAGPRLCLGKNIALIEAKILLASILKKYRISVVKSNPYKFDMILKMKKGLVVTACNKKFKLS